MEQPARVSSILGHIQLDGLEDRHVHALRARGLALVRSCGAWSIPVPKLSGAITHDPVGIAILVAIAEAGIAFLRDPRQGWSPADLMELVVERGAYPGLLAVCAFDGTRWRVWNHEGPG